MVDLVLLGFPSGSSEAVKMSRPKRGVKPPIYKPKKKGDGNRSRPLYVNLNTPEIPTLREDFDDFLKSIGYGSAGTEYVRWLISYAISNRLMPPDE